MENLQQEREKLSAARRRSWLSPGVVLLALAASNLLGCQRADDSTAAPWSDVIKVHDCPTTRPSLTPGHIRLAGVARPSGRRDATQLTRGVARPASSRADLIKLPRQGLYVACELLLVPIRILTPWR